MPQNEGYSQIISTQMPRSFGIGIKLNKDELDKVNKRRRSEKWCHYIKKSVAIEIYGNTKKKDIDDPLTLVRFFDLGINEEGYWNYFHIALQIEDAFNVLSVKYPNFNFFLIERYIKQMKTHRNVSDIEKGLIEREYASMGLRINKINEN